MALIVTGLAAAAAVAPVQLPPITGALGAKGYTVMALAADGRVTTAPAPTGRFRITPPAARVTLQLRAPDGTYAGPVVVARAAYSNVVVGVRAGAPLGPIALDPRLGYATVRRVAPRWIDRARWARARGGVEPFGVRSVGRELSAPPKRPPPGDADADGVPDVFDVDDDGDLVLDAVEPPARPDPVQITSQLAELDSPANVNAGMSRAQIEDALVRGATITIGSTVPGAVQCPGLAWCPPAPGSFAPRATSDQLRAGDVVIVGSLAGAVGAVFATVPVIASYTDAAGAHALRYPRDAGTQLPVAGSQVRLELWRPQRRAMPTDEVAEDEGRWVDMGGLTMSAAVAGGARCPADAYAAPDPVLQPFGDVFVDQAPDMPSGQGATFGYTLDLERCAAASGRTFAPGDQLTLLFSAGGATSADTFARAPA